MLALLTELSTKTYVVDVAVRFVALVTVTITATPKGVTETVRGVWIQVQIDAKTGPPFEINELHMTGGCAPKGGDNLESCVLAVVEVFGVVLPEDVE